MQNRTNEHWLRPCDLCGSLNYTQIAGGSIPLHRCCDCNLVQRADDAEEAPAPNSLDAAVFSSALSQIVRRIDGVPDPSVLIIGRPPESVLPSIRRSPLEVTLLVRHNETEGLEGTAFQTGGLEPNLFRPEQFDVILCARGMESLESAAMFFSRARLWLAPQGLLFVAGTNWGSLTRRLWSGRWRARHGRGRIFADYPHLKEYALRYGFEPISGGTRSRIAETAAVAFAVDSPTLLHRAAAFPFWLAATLPRLGDTWWSILSKRGYAVRPVLRRLDEEQERAPGLAAATFGSASMEAGNCQREKQGVKEKKSRR